MEIIVKKTNELSSIEQIQITALFNRVFLKNEVVGSFLKKYFWTNTEGSYHSLMLVNNEIVGCYSVIPYEYNFFDKKMTFGLSVDTMIDEEFRGNPFNFKKMATTIYDKLKTDGISFVFGFPNKNVYLVRKKILKWVDIDSLDFYILPIRVGQLKKQLKFANCLSRLSTYFIVLCSKIFSRSKDQDPNFKINKIISNHFVKQRYTEDYNVITNEDGYFVYKNHIENDAKIAYLIDVQPLQQKKFENAVNTIYTQEKDIDAIMYVGKLSFKPRNLIKIPPKFSPKDIQMSGLILDKTKVDESIFDVSNWQVNLSTFDVR